MSCAEGTLARTGRTEFTPVEKLFEGATLYGDRGEEPAVVDQPLQYAMRPCVTVKTSAGYKLVCETGHCFRLLEGGYVAANESLRRTICAANGVVEVVSVRRAGLKRVVIIHTVPIDQPYETNGILT
jgi:hypothetical protein